MDCDVEDIEILENLIKRCNKCDDYECRNCEISWVEVQAIKRLIVRNKKTFTRRIEGYMDLEQHIKNLKQYIKEDEIIENDNSDFAQFCKGHIEDIQAVLDELNNRIPKFLYDKLNEDFESYKNGKDINYLDNNHHKKLVEKSLGQIIKEPEECWFDSVEVKIIRNNTLYRIVDIKKDFVTLKELSDEYPEECFTVIAESPLSGAIYRYNNNGKHEWQLIGTMYGYA